MQKEDEWERISVYIYIWKKELKMTLAMKMAGDEATTDNRKD